MSPMIEAANLQERRAAVTHGRGAALAAPQRSADSAGQSIAHRTDMAGGSEPDGFRRGIHRARPGADLRSVLRATRETRISEGWAAQEIEVRESYIKRSPRC